MPIYHITAYNNVADGKVVDAKRIKHGVVTARKIADLSGWIDPVTHLNLDFPDHIMRSVIVAEALEKESNIMFDGDRFQIALIEPLAHAHHGMVYFDEPKRALKGTLQRNDQ